MVPAEGGRVVSSVLRSGQWIVELTPEAPAPDLVMTYGGEALPGVTVEPGPDAVRVRGALPDRVLSDGMHTILLRDGASGATLARLHVSAGSILGEDLAAEVSLLRAELEIVKRALRRLGHGD